MTTIRLTMAQALVRFLGSQRIDIDGDDVPLFPGVFGIFGHGNVTCLGEALDTVSDVLPTWRGQNEQSMSMAAVAYAKATRRRQVMIATSSIGPGALNMVTAAGVAMANRLPLLLLSGDTFVNRLPDPVLQQVEHFGEPGASVNDAFKAVVRYWDRVTHPAQLMQTLPQAVGVLLDPAETGPVFLGLPQDIQATAYEYPEEFFARRVHRIRRAAPDPRAIAEAADVIRLAQRPLVIAGGGVRYSEAEDALLSFAVSHGVPVCETVAGKGSLPWDAAHNVGPIGVTGSSSANALAERADVVIAVGTRLQDFTTGSWSVFGSERLRVVSINAGRHDAIKHSTVQVVGDARVALEGVSDALATWKAPGNVMEDARRLVAEWHVYVDSVRSSAASTETGLPSYAQVIGVINELAGEDDYVVAAAGGLPGELNKTWRTTTSGTFDCEYGFSCMGYEIGGAWGAAMARTAGDVISFCGDGSYMMMSPDVYSSVLSGHKMIVVLCDNGGYSVIQRLQEFQGGRPFNNRYDEGTRRAVAVEPDYAAHAASMGAVVETPSSLDDLAGAFARARNTDRTTVIVIRTDPYTWTGGDAWWDVGVPEVSDRPEVRQARESHEEARASQRRGV
ncbi:MAG TPA: 3D-(3,5/4)-trihydroxycyclohexane-1,2-dione acylhydrolase (decyclizing) [Acidimicrobiia bacterium]|nr:3D-(3,5/4)-trihydroxycyclohexane-1,2-dione acylhydrolase (decyclizing) [Acidimicrobiia bacterium]